MSPASCRDVRAELLVSSSELVPELLVSELLVSERRAGAQVRPDSRGELGAPRWVKALADKKAREGPLCATAHPPHTIFANVFGARTGVFR